MEEHEQADGRSHGRRNFMAAAAAAVAALGAEELGLLGGGRGPQTLDAAEPQVTGAVLDRGGAVYNVRHPDFWSRRTDTDDAPALQAAIDAAAAAGGGAVHLPAGDYTVRTTVRGAARIHLQGAGRGITRVRQGDGANLESLVHFAGADRGRPLADATVTGITFDGNKAANRRTHVGLLRLENTLRCEVERCGFVNAAGKDAPNRQNGGASLMFAQVNRHARVAFNLVEDGGDAQHGCDGIYTGGYGVRLIGNHIRNCWDTAIVYEAVAAAGEPVADLAVIQGNVIEDTPQAIIVDAGITGNHGAGAAIVGNVVRGTRTPNGAAIWVYRGVGSDQRQVVIADNVVRDVHDGHGIMVQDASEVVVSGNLVSDVSRGAGATLAFAGILVLSSTRVNVTGNTVLRTGGTGIQLLGATDTAVRGNVVRDAHQLASRAAVRAGIDVRDFNGAPCRRVQIVGNDSQGAQQYGLVLAGACDLVYVAGNDLRFNQSDPGFLNAATGAVRFGGPNLTRNAADALERIDNLLVAGRFGVAEWEDGAALPPLRRRIPVHRPDGSLLGYIPVHAAE